MNHELLKAELIVDECLGGKPALRAYRDSLGCWTIGIGHLLGKSDEPRLSVITEAESDALYLYDVGIAEAGARRLVPRFDSMSDPQQRALVNMVFNRGEARMRASSRIFPAILAASEGRAPWTGVRQAMSGTQWAGQVGKRADRLADRFEQLA